MSEVAPAPRTSRRKADHIRINLDENVQFPRLTTGLEQYTFMHQAVPELDLNAISTRTAFLGKPLRAPLLISCMTGGTDEARAINRNLAAAAQEAGIAMGLGSQRAAIEDASLADTYRVRDVAPDILLFANLGAVQLNYGYGVEQCCRAVDMVEADALVLHLNVLQEAVQPEGDVNFGGLLHKIEVVCRALPVPVIAKEVGWGISAEAARQLADAGVQVIDVAGAGGTSWSEVEYHRAPSTFHAEVAASFADWGIPTAHSLIYARRGAPEMPLIASGGLRNGIDVAKCIALGAGLCGLAGPFLRAGVESGDAVLELTALLEKQLRVAMFGAGAGSLSALAETPLHLAAQPPLLDET
ncbi:MAG: type 2 isopentenyl-diphosphate Delta-isomerase [Anaerolineae bacterium]|nr:type 2 isopentenyl-diphosphate Delta-isomerase [Anaerolineae bacterium]